MLEFAVAHLFMAGPCIGRLWQVSRCSTVATQKAFLLLLIFVNPVFKLNQSVNCHTSNNQYC